MPLQLHEHCEPIPGYTLIERIGAGGYGEVWKCTAPGGLIKAIKFVFGYMDEDRAARELKALNRIKEVRHPFLLSLERIEVVDGQLVIVTELADGCLKDRFDQCRASGVDGISRDELLVLISDAADALDFMREKFTLQHLDVKPENLLMLGSRVKVADFGLVKQLQDVTASLMGGLTPLYAPPELFDGQPSLYSDQYSLAIVYTEMLTGALPFPGTTAAQLAAQHLNAKPRLELLSPRDRAIIARALEKDPQQRFGSCREMVESLRRKGEPLLEQTQPLLATNQRAGPALAVGDVEARCPVTTPPLATRGKLAPAATLIPKVGQSPVVRNAEPVDWRMGVEPLRPTVFLGIGGIAADVLAGLRRRLNQSFGNLAEVPALRTLLLDTDSKSLTLATQRDESSRLGHDEILSLPLRRPQDYRDSSDKFLKSVSRRWLYNIPKSLQTEGLRPLGHLAFLDHADQILARLREVIPAVMQPTAIEASSKKTGRGFHTDAPRVVIVSSISGGAGAGMIVDLAFAVRAVLAESNYHGHVCGMLTHATGRQLAAKDLAVATAYSCLGELQHFNCRGTSYPGESTCGIPAFDKETGVFDDTYLIHFGDEIGDDQFRAGAETVAEYLFLDSATTCGSLFDKWRGAAPGRTDSSPVTVRTFGVSQVRRLPDDVLAGAIEQLCLGTVNRWNGPASRDSDSNAAAGNAHDGPQAVPPADAGQRAARYCQQVGLEFDTLVDRTEKYLLRALGADVDTILQGLLHSRDGQTIDSDAARRAIDVLLLRDGRDDGSPLGDKLQALHEQAAPTGENASGWLSELFANSEFGLAGADQAAQWLTQHLRSFESRSREELQRLEQEMSSLTAPATKQSPRNSKSLTAQRDELLQYFKLRLQALAVGFTSDFARPITRRVSLVVDQLRELGRELSLLSTRFNPPPRRRPSADGQSTDLLEGLKVHVEASLHGQLAELSGQVHETFCRNFLDTRGGMRQLLTAKSDLLRAIPDALRHAARQVICAADDCTNIVQLLAPANENPRQTKQRLEAWKAAAMPKLTNCGGVQRTALILPAAGDHTRLAEIFQHELGMAPNVVNATSGDAVLCCEVESISLAHIAVMLIDGRRDYAEVASRLRTRADIDWAPWSPDEIKA